jgi:hypothetical protein
MTIKLYEKYVHKSRMFCYPLIGLKRGAEFLPKQTYMSWKGVYSANDYKLICHYTNCNSQSFEKFSKVYLESNILFEKIIKLDMDQIAYIFDFSMYKKDWNCILSGKYSKLSNAYKKNILKFFFINRGNYEIIKKILYPSNHFNEFAFFFNVSPELISTVGEVLDLPDFHREEFLFDLIHEHSLLF